MMREAATETVGDGIAWALIALGITFHGTQFLGGLFYALAAAMLTRHWFPEKDRREIWATLLAAFLVSVIGAGCYWGFYDGAPPVPVQFVMGIFGLSSRVAVSTYIKLLIHTENKSDMIAGRLIDRVLPGKGGDE